MRIILDMDQVLARWAERVLEWWNEDNGTSLTIEDIREWEIAPSLSPDRRTGDYFVRSCMRYPEFYRDLDPVEGAIDGVRALMELGHDVYIGTAVPRSAPIAYAGKLEWVRRRMPFFPADRLIGIKHKHLLSGDVLFDDGVHNVLPWALSGRTAVVLDYPWNREPVSTEWHTLARWEEARANIVRVGGWLGFLDIVGLLSAKKGT